RRPAPGADASDGLFEAAQAFAAGRAHCRPGPQDRRQGSGSLRPDRGGKRPHHHDGHSQ
ncbi:DUF5067 domain-containing protein, partial [Dysosmobacter welbionis]